MISISSFAALFLAETATGPAGFLSNGLIMPIALVVMFYFLLIRPQQKQRKEQAARIAALQTGDKIVTSSGIYGIVHSIKDTTVIVKVDEGTKIEFEKAAIASVSKKEVK